MTVLSAIIALAAAILLLTAGYLLGVRRGAEAREMLREVNQQQKQALQLAQREIERKVDTQEQSLRTTIELALAPLFNREQISFDLASLKTGEGARDLTLLLDRIAEAGNFSTVALSDDEGLALAGNTDAQDLERIAVNASVVQLMAERIGSSEFPAPTAVLLRDPERLTLYRMFEVQDRKIALIAVSTGAHLTPTSLDAALPKVSGMLTAKA